MKIVCPHCHVKGKAAETLSGRKVCCPECNWVFRITEDVTVGEVLEVKAETRVQETSGQRAAVASAEEATVTEQESLEEQAVVGLPEGLAQCANCNYVFSERFMEGTLCPVCAG